MSWQPRRGWCPFAVQMRRATMKTVWNGSMSYRTSLLTDWAETKSCYSYVTSVLVQYFRNANFLNQSKNKLCANGLLKAWFMPLHNIRKKILKFLLWNEMLVVHDWCTKQLKSTCYPWVLKGSTNLNVDTCSQVTEGEQFQLFVSLFQVIYVCFVLHTEMRSNLWLGPALA